MKALALGKLEHKARESLLKIEISEFGFQWDPTELQITLSIIKMDFKNKNSLWRVNQKTFEVNYLKLLIEGIFSQVV